MNKIISIKTTIIIIVIITITPFYYTYIKTKNNKLISNNSSKINYKLVMHPIRIILLKNKIMVDQNQIINSKINNASIIMYILHIKCIFS